MLLVSGSVAVAQPGQSRVEGKKFAAYEYGWYPITFVDHFVERLSRFWKVEGSGRVRTQNGMITIMSTAHGSIGATLRKHAHDRGRWEIRLRARRYEVDNRNFTVAAELVPATRAGQRCGAQNIALASFKPTGHKVRHHIRTLPDNSFNRTRTGMNLSDDYWHTYGLEVTPRRISWFMDGKVRSTERRRDALSGIPLTLRLQLQHQPGQTMNPSRLQVDTVRYFTLKSPNKKSIKAERPGRSTYPGAC